jgi:hypothetical protein
MPSRLIRDDMLESERVHGVPVEARWLYVSLLLGADDVGLLELNAFKIARRAGLDQRMLDKLLPLLVDADLVRAYSAAGKRYLFLPRYGQRLQIKRSKCPLPPLALLDGDEDAIKKIKHLGSEPPCITVDHGNPPPEPEPEPEPVVASADAAGRQRARSASPAPDLLGDSNLQGINARALVALGARFELPAEWGLDAEALGWKPGDILRESERFRQYWTTGKGSGKRRSIRGWRQAWANWLSKAENFKR